MNYFALKYLAIALFQAFKFYTMKKNIILALSLFVTLIGFSQKVDKALNKAINVMDVKAAQKAIDEGANVNTRQYGKSALFNAVGLGHRNLIQLLLDKKADVKEIEISGLVDKRCILTYVGLTQQEYAQWWNDYYKKYVKKDTLFDPNQFCSPYQLAEMLCKAGADVNGPGIMEGTPMNIALSKKYSDVAQLYLKYGYNVNKRLFMLEDKYDKDRARFEALAKEQKVKFDHSDVYPTGLMIAIQNGDVPLVKAFIEHKADVNMKKTDFEDVSSFVQGKVRKDKISTLTMAKQYGNQEIIDLLVKAGAVE